MYLCNEIIMNGIIRQRRISPLKSSQGLSVVAESPFTFQPGLHSCYYATILTSAFQRAMQITKIYSNGANR
jgi:hypothetical protein